VNKRLFESTSFSASGSNLSLKAENDDFPRVFPQVLQKNWMVVLGIRPQPFQCPFFPLHFLLITLSFDVIHSELLTAVFSETRKNIHQCLFPFSWCSNVWWTTVTSPGFVDPIPWPCPTKQSPERPCRTSNFLCLVMCCYWCSCCGRAFKHAVSKCQTSPKL
jgi:hypothetical protein